MGQIISEEEDTLFSVLMARGQGGDETAYAELLAGTARSLHRYVAPKVFEAQGVDEVIQESLISVHEYRHTYDPSRSYASWLFAIGSNRLADYWRKTKTRERRELAMDDGELDRTTAPADGEGREEARRALTRMIAELPERQSRVVELLKLDGLSIREAAARLGMSEAAVKVTAHRAYKALETNLKGAGHGDR